MLSRSLLFLLASSVRLGAGQDSGYQQASGEACCDALRNELPSSVGVFARGTSEYNARHQTYYSLQQQELFPTCTVKPNTASDVSQILRVAEAHKCPFAVASGGHMSWKGSSNIDGNFVIDLRALDQIDISPQDQTVKLGPGLPWINVYAALAPFNISTTGARNNFVGVGGFLTGGGITFESITKGFGADNVFQYEVVLANGSIVSVNKDTNADLFWALKLAGTNFGIVTQYEMTTFPSPVIWGAVSAYPITDQSTSDLLRAFEAYGHDDTNTNTFQSVSFASVGGVDMLSVVQCTLDGVPQGPLTSVEPISHSELVGSTHDVINQVIQGALAPTARTHWYTFTTRINTPFFKDMRAKADEIFTPLNDRDGLTWAIGFQALQKSFIARTAGSPVFNALTQANDDLVFILLLVTWDDPADELVMRNATNALGAWGEAEAERRGVLSQFVYLNYANEEQRIYERAVTKEDLDRLRTVQKTYDPSGTFVKLWKGGYKIPAAGYHGAETDTGVVEEQGHDEL
ncbi:hypothetical protein E1B28_011599 [Marasmius oreades]|uniref:FAD-binding PCMH-type domain-containing protein n=1 Tax=Marasmius oreades TaxID=181124 RepID=A0A9P7US96_9AGAR|nr:uncharacterized protein E1B28_011599 [Marasmius oreades]KAG7089974.1 hypothetical protein E1B28_011599 [Marasmius oreades]